MQPGYATPQATRDWAQRHAATVHVSQWRQLNECVVAPLGLGTYLGAPDAKTDAASEIAVLHYLAKGGNVIDTASNYRMQCSERSIGRALQKAFVTGVPRNAVFVASKCGFIPGDAALGGDLTQYIRSALVESGIITTAEIVAGCHCLSPAYIRHQIEQSRRNLQLETLDLYYLHNPETQLEEISHSIFLDRMLSAFAELESAVKDGKIRAYGVATWDGFRVPPTSKMHLSMDSLLGIARSVGGENHHFKAIQLPFNLLMPEAVFTGTQPAKPEPLPVVVSANAGKVAVLTSAPLMQSQLTKGLPKEMFLAFPDCANDAARALAFVMNAPGITATMCGMKQAVHIDANWVVAMQPHLEAEQWVAAVEKLQ